jgi:uncharacterized small protein (DUF1192 family)
MDVIPAVLSFLCLILIITLSIYIIVKVENTKKDCRNELKKFATLVNDAQYNEYNFDKLNEQNIKNLENRIKVLQNEINKVKPELDKLIALKEAQT